MHFFNSSIITIKTKKKRPPWVNYITFKYYNEAEDQVIRPSISGWKLCCHRPMTAAELLLVRWITRIVIIVLGESTTKKGGGYHRHLLLKNIFLPQ